MARAIRLILRTILYVPLYCLGWILFGVLYVEAWLLDFISEDK